MSTASRSRAAGPVWLPVDGPRFPSYGSYGHWAFEFKQLQFVNPSSREARRQYTLRNVGEKEARGVTEIGCSDVFEDGDDSDSDIEIDVSDLVDRSVRILLVSEK
ncbi:hypothetical protein H4Q26_004463 [Puccinia striiformis f. sp. tritici PST-130]|nr:hypothetical protein H4Q26_004463 [Puccinia striiformis f. sp. tritici PST-130]